MEGSHNTAPPIKAHEPTPTSTRESAPPPKPTAASPACQASYSDPFVVYKLIDTTELCEQTLGYLSCTELCRAKRVCQRFRDVIDNSLVLQRNLFLKPCDGARPKGPRKTGDTLHNLQNFHPLLTSDIAPNPESDFQIKFWPVCIYSGDGWNPSMDKLTQTFEDVSGVSDDSSLHKMYLSNPPLTQISLRIEVPHWYKVGECMSWKFLTESPYLSWDTWRSDKAITFGQVFDYAKTVIRAHHRMTFPDEHPDFSGQFLGRMAQLRRKNVGRMAALAYKT